jgi:hypothetical protein
LIAQVQIHSLTAIVELVEASEDTSQSAPASQPVQPEQDIPANVSMLLCL